MAKRKPLVLADGRYKELPLDDALDIGPVRLGNYTLATLPDATLFAGYTAQVGDAPNGSALYQSDGTTWSAIKREATAAKTANTLVLRDANADAAFRSLTNTGVSGVFSYISDNTDTTVPGTWRFGKSWGGNYDSEFVFAFNNNSFLFKIDTAGNITTKGFYLLDLPASSSNAIRPLQHGNSFIGFEAPASGIPGQNAVIQGWDGVKLISATGDFIVMNGVNEVLLRAKPSGRVLVGPVTDDGASQLQIAGDVKAVAGAFSGAISGTNFSGSSSGTNTGDQTTVTGNAGSATVLQNARNIGISGDLVGIGTAFNGAGAISIPGTLATVNADVGTYGSASMVPILTVNAKGLVTGVTLAALTAGAGGTAGQLQYNDAGSLAGAAKVEIGPVGNLFLVENTTKPAAPPVGRMIFYGRSRAGAIWADCQRPNGRDFSLQPHMGVTRVGSWMPSTTTVVNTSGVARTAVGTVSHPVLASTNLSTSMRRWRMTSAATASSVCDERIPTTAFWRGNVAGQGGITYINRFNLTTTQTGSVAFFGVMASIAALATTQTIAALINCVGIGFTQGTDTNWQMITNDATGAPTKVDMGASFPVANTSNVYTLFVSCGPNASSWWVRVVEEVSGAVFEQEITIDIPANTVFLSARSFLHNGGVAAAVAYDCAGVYLDSDY